MANKTAKFSGPVAMMTPPEPDNSKKHLIVLSIIGVAWLIVFFAFLVGRARVEAIMLPFITITFLAYGAWASYQLIQSSKNNRK